MMFDPSRVPVLRVGLNDAPLDTGYFVDLRPFAAWLVREIAGALPGHHTYEAVRKLADKIAAASGEQGSGAVAPGVSSPAAPSKQEIDAAIEWVRFNAYGSPSGQRAVKVISGLITDLLAARAALRWVSNEYLPNRHDWPKEHDAALRAALAERP